MRLARVSWCVLPVVAAALATAVPLRVEELALSVPSPSRILLDLQRREISVVLDGRMRGSLPVAIGDPKTPTPQGEFSILKKTIDPIPFQKSLDSARNSAVQQVRSVTAIWPSIATVAVNSESTELPGPIG